MYTILFRLQGNTQTGCSSIVVAQSEIGNAVELLEAAKAQYKVYRGATYLPQKTFGMGGYAGWLAEDAIFDHE